VLRDGPGLLRLPGNLLQLRLLLLRLFWQHALLLRHVCVGLVVITHGVMDAAQESKIAQACESADTGLRDSFLRLGW
jgi:hypothetical protein